MKRRLRLEYDLDYAWLSPWLEGVRAGKAVASTCSACGDVQFPPLRICPACRAVSDGWRTLPGGASILWRTTGADGDFALARFDGASTAAVVRAVSLPAGATRGQLAACPDDPPALSIIMESET